MLSQMLNFPRDFAFRKTLIKAWLDRYNMAYLQGHRGWNSWEWCKNDNVNWSCTAICNGSYCSKKTKSSLFLPVTFDKAKVFHFYPALLVNMSNNINTLLKRTSRVSAIITAQKSMIIHEPWPYFKWLCVISFALAHVQTVSYNCFFHNNQLQLGMSHWLASSYVSVILEKQGLEKRYLSDIQFD